MTPMFVDYQNDDQCYTIQAQYQYMFGKNLLVAPILSATNNFRKVYLPKGKWMDWWSSKIYNGGQWITVDSPLWEIPLFVKEGGIIPMQETEQYVGEKQITQLSLKIFPSKNSSYTLYEDDGKTINYQKGKYSLTKFDLTKENGTTKLSVSKIHNGYKNDRKDYLINFYNVIDASNVKVGNRELQSFDSLNKLNDSEEGFTFDKANNLLTVKVKDSGEFVLTYGKY